MIKIILKYSHWQNWGITLYLELPYTWTYLVYDFNAHIRKEKRLEIT